MLLSVLTTPKLSSMKHILFVVFFCFVAIIGSEAQVADSTQNKSAEKSFSFTSLPTIAFSLTAQATHGLTPKAQSGKPGGRGIEFEGGVLPKGRMHNFNYFRFCETDLNRLRDTRFCYGSGMMFNKKSALSSTLILPEANTTQVDFIRV